MADPDLALLKILIERTSYMNNYWNLYIVASAAIVGILSSGKDFTRLLRLRVVLCLVFISFALSNLCAILSLVDQRNAVLNQLSEMVPAELKASLTPEPRLLYLAFHVLLDLLIACSILFVPWHSLGKETVSD
ncbi:hypothetical protein KUV39_17850 [Phaeobacter italicus]|uniref:hypothetical protein n=1 Tax=Phaeobacter italicus TaxID=481446 RepID=UPI001C9603C3|nr:hypothetical protein [Phaeobacter italicus]MBY5978520.1 hypothetical protein [Phaeobacter italicus]